MAIRMAKIKMKITLNNKFYKKESISKSIKDFEGLANITLLNDSFDIEMVPIDEELLNLKEEFCNYVLALMKNKGLV